MKVPNPPTLVRRMLAARVKRLAARGPVLQASLVQIAKHCGREGCRCQRGHKHVGNYLTFKEAGKTRDGKTRLFAWITNIRVSAESVDAIATS